MCFLDPTWRPTREQALAAQEELAPSVRICGLRREPRNVAGADVAYSRNGDECFAAIVVLDKASGAVLDCAVFQAPVPYPYLSGLLAFREVPPLARAFSQLRITPELLFVDGHGIFHPRGVGLASHLGLLLDIPTIGCGKGPPFRTRAFRGLARTGRGSYHPVSLPGHRPSAALLHTKDLHKPIFISPGHRITLKESIDWALRTTGRYRVPEPIRRAHQLAGQKRNEAEALIRDQGSGVRGQAKQGER